MMISNRQELQNITVIHSGDIDYKDFMKVYRKCANKPYSHLTIDTTLPSDHSSRFTQNLLEEL